MRLASEVAICCNSLHRSRQSPKRTEPSKRQSFFRCSSKSASPWPKLVVHRFLSNPNLTNYNAVCACELLITASVVRERRNTSTIRKSLPALHTRTVDPILPAQHACTGISSCGQPTYARSQSTARAGEAAKTTAKAKGASMPSNQRQESDLEHSSQQIRFAGELRHRT